MAKPSWKNCRPDLTPFKIDKTLKEMKKKKKILYWGLLLNCVFYFGAALTISKQHASAQTQFINHKLAKTVKNIFDEIHNDQPLLQKKVDEASSNSSQPDKRQFFSDFKNLKVLITEKDDQLKEWIGKKEELLFPPSLYRILRSGLYRKDETLFFAYFLSPNSVTDDSRYLLAVGHPSASVTELLHKNGVDLLLMEDANGSKLNIFSSLDPMTAKQLFENFERNDRIAFLDSDIEGLASSVSLISLQNEKYAMLPVKIEDRDHFYQHALYTMKLDDFKAIDSFSVFLFLGALFVASMALTIVVYFKTHED